jgi:hypothetical protein
MTILRKDRERFKPAVVPIVVCSALGAFGTLAGTVSLLGLIAR